MEKTASKKNKKQVSFSWLSYSLFMLLCLVGKLLFNGRVKKTEAFKSAIKNESVLILCNHASAYDFAFFSPPFVGKKLSFVVAENMLYAKSKFLAYLIRKNAITKKQFVADISCIRSVKRSMDAGISVALCPEGQVCPSGKTGVIPEAIGKLIKFLGYPVVVCVTEGSGLSRSKWGYTSRRGRVTTRCDALYSQDDIKNLSAEELYEGCVKALQFNEYVYQIENDITFRGARYAEGLERILYHCPKCGSDFNMTTSGNILKCEKCNNTIKYTNKGKLVPQNKDSICPERVDLWYDIERELVREEAKNEDFTLTEEVALFVENPEISDYRFIATGTAVLSKENLTFTANIDERPKKIISEYGVSRYKFELDMSSELEPVEEEFKKVSINIKNSPSAEFMPGLTLELYDSNHAYRIMFMGQKSSTKFALAIEELYKLRKGEK